MSVCDSRLRAVGAAPRERVSSPGYPRHVVLAGLAAAVLGCNRGPMPAHGVGTEPHVDAGHIETRVLGGVAPMPFHSAEIPQDTLDQLGSLRGRDAPAAPSSSVNSGPQDPQSVRLGGEAPSGFESGEPAPKTPSPKR